MDYEDLTLEQFRVLLHVQVEKLSLPGGQVTNCESLYGKWLDSGCKDPR